MAADGAAPPPDALLALLAEARVRLADLTRAQAEVVAASRDSNADDEHDPEGATIAFERAQLGALRDLAAASLEAAEEAVRRRRSGGYGTCAVCGGRIGAERLEARPAATTCIGCARGAGRSPGGTSGPAVPG